MNLIILMIGSIFVTYIIILSLLPDYKKIKKKVNCSDERDYHFRFQFLSIIFSLTINFLTWGWFI